MCRWFHRKLVWIGESRPGERMFVARNRIRVENEPPAYATGFAKDDLFVQFEMTRESGWPRESIRLFSENIKIRSFAFSYFLIFTNSLETNWFHVSWPCAKPIIPLWMKSDVERGKRSSFEQHSPSPRTKTERTSRSENERLSATVLPLISRKPERITVFFTMFGVIVLIFHFIILRNGNGNCSTIDR